MTVPEARMIQIQPWEGSMVKVIEKAILTSDLGINPTNDGKVIRLVFPELTEERRKELVKDVKKKGENAKVAVRNIRRDANDAFKKLLKQDVSEDEVKELEEKTQKLTDKFIKEIDATVEANQKRFLRYKKESEGHVTWKGSVGGAFMRKEWMERRRRMNVPNHIAIILDGNGRWAKKRGMPRGYGHVKAVRTWKRSVKWQRIWA